VRHRAGADAATWRSLKPVALPGRGGRARGGAGPGSAAGSRPPAAAAAAPFPQGLPALLFLLLAAVYTWTACRTVGPGDSGELTVVMASWGVAHAPGYPLLTLLGNLVSHLPHPGEPAFVLNLLDAGFGALACAVLSAAIATQTGNPWAGFAAGLALGTSRIFWEYALVVEVFSLTALMGALLLLFLAHFLKGIERDRIALWPLPASALVMSTVVTHHATLSLLAGPLVLVYAAVAPSLARRGVARSRLLRVGALVVAAALTGLLPLLYIPLAARHDPPLNWGNAQDLHGLLRLLLRQDFGSGRLAIQEVVVRTLLENGERASPLGLRHLGLFLSDLPHSFGWLYPALAPLGLYWAARRARALLLLTVLFLGALVVFFGRVNTPIVPLYLGVTRPFYILAQLVLAFLGGLGIAQLMGRAARFHSRGSAVAWVLVMIGTGPAMLLLHWRSVDMRGNTFTRDLGANLMAGMPSGAIVFSSGDLFRNSFHYQQVCLGRRRDLTLVDQPMMAAAWYVDQLRRRHALELPDRMTAYTGEPATRSRAWLDLNLGPAAAGARRRILAVQCIDDDYRSAYRLVPMGLWAEVRPGPERPDLGPWADAYSDVVRRWAIPSLDVDYPGTSWEASTGTSYTRALANLEALRDLVRALGRGSSPEPPALAAAGRWRDLRRADYLANQAEFWLVCNVDSLVPPREDTDSLLATTALALARASLVLDPDNLHGLKVAAALMSAVPRLDDPRAEAQIRRRIVLQRPGDLSELTAYLRAAARLMRDPAVRNEGLQEEAEAARRRFVGLLDLALKLGNDPDLERQRERWSAPLQGPDDPRLRSSGAN